MSFFSRKKKEDGAPAASGGLSGYPGMVAAAAAGGGAGAGSQQQQQQNGFGGSPSSSSSYSFSPYPAAVAGYQPPAFHPANGASPASNPSPSASPYQPSASAAYAVPASHQQQQHHPMGQASSYQSSPPPPHNPHAVSASPTSQPSQQFGGGYAAAVQTPYAGLPQSQYLQPQQPPSAQSSLAPTLQQQQAYGDYGRYQQPQQQPPPLSYPPASSPSSQPQFPHFQLRQVAYQPTGYSPQMQQPPYTPSPASAGNAAAGGSSASPSSSQHSGGPLAERKPWESAQQAAARLARAEASEQRVGDMTASSLGGKQKTWAAYQEIEREEREKQQRIQQRQQQLQQQQQQAQSPLTSAAVEREAPPPSHRYQQLQPVSSFPSPQYQPAQYEQLSMLQPQPQQQQQQHQPAPIPDLLTWDVQPAPAADGRGDDLPTPRAAEQQVEQNDEDEDAQDDQKQMERAAARSGQQDEEDEDEEEDQLQAEEKKQQQQRLEDDQEGQEGQSWQQIGKGKRPVDEFDTDSHGEGQTKDEVVPVSHLIEYAEKQEQSLQQPLLSPTSAAHARAASGQQDIALLAPPAPQPAVAASRSFDFLVDNNQPLLPSPKVPTGGSAAQAGGSVVLAAPKRVKKKKPAPATEAAPSVASVNSSLSELSIGSNHYAPQRQQPAQSNQQWIALPQQPQAPQQQQQQPLPQPQPQQQPQVQSPPYYQQQPPPPTAIQQLPAPSPSSLAASVALSSPYAQRLHAGFAFQLYTDTSTHDLFLFYEPQDGPRGTLYWCQPGKRDKNSQHSMPIHEITHSVLGKHNFPMVNPRAVAAAPIQCFTLYDKQKRLDMCADSGANREEFLQCLEMVIKEGHQMLPQPPPVSHPSQPQPSAVTAVRTQPVMAPVQAVPAQVISSSPTQQPPQAGGYYATPTVQQPQAVASYPYPQFGNPFPPAQAVQSSSYPAMQAQQQQAAAPFNFAYGLVPGMSRPAASQPFYGQPQAQVLQSGYPAYVQSQPAAAVQQPPLLPPPSQLVQENPDLIKPVHVGLKCDSCGVSPIKDVRYKCTLCFNFDLCEKCERKGKHPRSHPLLKMLACGRSRDVAELFHRAQYKELQHQQLMKRPGGASAGSLLTEDVRFDAYHKDMLSRVMASAHTLPPETMRYLIEILVQLMTATEETREAYCHIRLRDDSTQRLLLPYTVALDLLRLCGFDYVQAKSSGDNLSFQGMEQFDELYFNPNFKLTVVETVVERLLRL